MRTFFLHSTAVRTAGCNCELAREPTSAVLEGDTTCSLVCVNAIGKMTVRGRRQGLDKAMRPPRRRHSKTERQDFRRVNDMEKRINDIF